MCDLEQQREKCVRRHEPLVGPFVLPNGLWRRKSPFARLVSGGAPRSAVLLVQERCGGHGDNDHDEMQETEEKKLAENQAQND